MTRRERALLRDLITETVRTVLRELEERGKVRGSGGGDWQSTKESTDLTSKQRKTFIYALCDPDTGDIRYIGKANDPEGRYCQHVAVKVYQDKLPLYDSPKEAWIRSLIVAGKLPELRILERVPLEEYWRAERRWMNWAIDQGFDVTNGRDPC